MDGLKKRLEDVGSLWVDYLQYILWTYRTTLRRATIETPFALIYGFDAKALWRSYRPLAKSRSMMMRTTRSSYELRRTSWRKGGKHAKGR